MALTSEQETLLAKGIIELRNDVDEEMSTYVRDCLPLLVVMGNPDLNVWITSPGGSLLGGLIIYDTLVAYPGKVTSTVIGYCQSMAVAILQACDLRQATPNARFLIHDPIFTQISLNTLVSQSRVAKALADQEQYFQRIYQILCTATGRSMFHIRATCRKQREMFPEEAKKFGLIDQIVTRPKRG